MKSTMKIPESIINKYQLAATSNHIGEAVIHNLQVFKSELLGFESVLFMECDFDGKPIEYIRLFNKSNNRKADVTLNFIGEVPADEILKFVI